MISTPIRILGKGAVYVALTAVGVVAEKVVSKKLGELDYYASEHGGYKKVAETNLRAANIQARRAVFHTSRSLDQKLEPVVEGARKGGKRLCTGVLGAVSDCTQVALESWYGYFPRREELEDGGIYAGIGDSYKDMFLTRADCEGCLRFSEEAKVKIPDSEVLKSAVIHDIIRSASHDLKGLEKFYQVGFFWNMSDTDSLKRTMDSVYLAGQYLQEPSTN